MQESTNKSSKQKIITWKQYSNHITPQNCWVLVDGYIYDVSDYLVEHPGGDDILLKYSGIDASIAFNNQNHSKYAVSLRDARKVGRIQSPLYDEQYRLILQQKKKLLKQNKKTINFSKKSRQNISLSEVAQHNTTQNCWIIIEDKVYDLTDYMSTHPGGEGIILQKGGKDATKAFKQANHSLEAIQKKSQYLVGSLEKQQNKNYFLIFGLLVFILSIIGILVSNGSLEL